MEDPTMSAQDPLPMDLPPDTIIVEPSDDYSDIEGSAHTAVREDMLVESDPPQELTQADKDKEQRSTERQLETTHDQSSVIVTDMNPGSPPSNVEPIEAPSADQSSVIVTDMNPGSPPSNVEPIEAPSADQSQERGWLHRDMLTNKNTVPLSPEEGADSRDTDVEGENHDRDGKNVSDPKGTDDPPPFPAIMKLLNDSSTRTVEAPSGDADLVKLSSNAAFVQPFADQTTTHTTTKELTAAPQQSPKSSWTPSPNRTNNLEAKKNRLLDILNAKTKDLAMNKQKDIIHVPINVISSCEPDSNAGSLFELPPNTEVIHPISTVQTPEPMDIDIEDGEESGHGSEVTKDDPHLIINKPVTQIMGKSKRKAKKPLPNRSSLVSMIDAASDITDFFSIANTLHDSEEDDIHLVGVDVDPTHSKTEKTPEANLHTQSKKSTGVAQLAETSVPASQTVPVVITATYSPTSWTSTDVVSQQASTVTVNSAVYRPPNPQMAAPQTTINIQPSQQHLSQPTQFVQQVVQQQHSQFPILQQKLIQPLQGQILVQGNIMQSNILQTQQAGSTGGLIVQQQQPQQQQQQPQQQQYVPIQSIQQTIPMPPIIQQTAVMPSMYQNQLPIVQHQVSH